MDYDKACEILEISQKHTSDQVKKAYFRMALRFHPDKYKDDNGEKFKEVKSAYEFLSSRDKNYEKINIDDDINYKELIKMCVKYFSPDTNWDNIFIDTSFQGIMKDCQKISLKIFEKLNKERARQVYEFIYKFNSVMGVDIELLNNFKKILQNKMVYDNIIILNPSLKDLFNDNIFKLEIDEKEFYVPLWHHELHYGLKGKDLVVRCEPEIPDNIWINESNNIYLTMQISIKDLFEKGFHEFEV